MTKPKGCGQLAYIYWVLSNILLREWVILSTYWEHLDSALGNLWNDGLLDDLLYFDITSRRNKEIR